MRACDGRKWVGYGESSPFSVRVRGGLSRSNKVRRNESVREGEVVRLVSN